MASNPYFSPLHTQRFSFIGSPQQRDGTYTKDQRFVNMYPELIKSDMTDGKKYYLKKRPGTSPLQTFPSGNSQGIFYWNGDYYTAVAGIMYKNMAPLIALANSTSPVGFAEFRTDAEDVLFFCDGQKGYVVNSSGVPSNITDPNFPNPHIPAPIFLDGYIFLAQATTQTIRNSTLQDPNTWPSDGFIDAEMYPDNIVTLTKAQNYLVAVGTQSIEFFYDNGTATGSPLQRNAPAVAQFGCPAPGTVNQTEKQVILVGATNNGGRTIWVVDGFQPTEIATEPVREALDLEGTSINLANANTVQVAGHKWYILNLLGASRTFVYDFDERMWHEWTSGDTQQAFGFRYAADSNQGFPVFLGYNGGTTVELSPSNYTDNGIGIRCAITTSKIDFDTIKRKRFYRLSLTTDASNGNTPVPMTVYWSDDDYNTWTSGTTLLISGNYPSITQLGYSRRRAFQFVFEQPYPLRMESFEVDIIQEVRR